MDFPDCAYSFSHVVGCWLLQVRCLDWKHASLEADNRRGASGAAGLKVIEEGFGVQSR